MNKSLCFSGVMHNCFSQYKQATLLVPNNLAQHVKVTCNHLSATEIVGGKPRPLAVNSKTCTDFIRARISIYMCKQRRREEIGPCLTELLRDLRVQGQMLIWDKLLKAEPVFFLKTEWRLKVRDEQREGSAQ